MNEIGFLPKPSNGIELKNHMKGLKAYHPPLLTDCGNLQSLTKGGSGLPIDADSSGESGAALRPVHRPTQTPFGQF